MSSDTDFFLNQTGGSVSQQLGTRLNNFKNQVLSTQSVIGIQPDNSTDAIPYTAFGKSLLNVSTLNGLVGLINSADTNVSVIDSGVGQIDFTLDNALKLSVRNAYTEVLNELRSLNIVPATDLEYNLGTSTKRYNYGYFRRIASNTSGQVAVGDGAGTAGTSSINIGMNAGGGTPDYSVSIGRGSNTIGHTRSIAIGYASGQNGGTAVDYTTSIGFQAGFGVSGSSVNQMKAYATAIGYSAGMNGLGTSAIAIGTNSGAGTSGSALKDYGISIGESSAKAGQGTNSIAIGYKAGETSSHDKTIILNATGVAVNSDGTDRCFIAPIRSNGTGNVLNYDSGSKEVLSGGNVSMQTLTSQGLNPDLLNSRNIGTTSLPWNGVHCNILIQPSATNAMAFNTNGSDRMFINSSGTLVLARGIAGGSGLQNGGIMLFNGSGNNESRGASSAILSNEIRGLSGSGSDAGVLRIGAGGGSSSANHSYIDFEGYGTRCIRFNTGGAFRAIIDASGNIGVGTSSPQSLLDVRGTTTIKNGNGAGLNTLNQLLLNWGQGIANYSHSIKTRHSETIDADNAIDFYLWQSSQILTPNAIGNKHGMTLNVNGLGLGTTIPAERLDVVGNAKITGDIVFDADNQRKLASNGSALKEVHCHTAFLKSIEVHSTTAGNIATSAKPFNTLFVSNIGSSGTSVQTLYADVWATSATTGLRCANNLVLATDLALPTITWYDVNAKSMILVDTVNTTDGGKLSYDSANSEIVIGTTSPSVERLRVGSDIKTSVNILPTDANRMIGSSTAKFNTVYTSTILNPDSNLILGRGTTSTVAISTTGMSVNSGSNPTEALFVNGNIKLTGNILPNVHNVPKIGTSNSDRFLEGWFGTVYGNGVALTSDRRLKDNIKPITNALETVMKMKPVEYKMKGRVRTHTGFIADEVKNLYNGEDWAVFVESQDEFKTQSLQYTEIVAVLTSALQEINNRLSKVESRKLVGNSVIDTSGLTEDMVSIYQRLEALELEINKPVKPQLHRCVEVSRINEMMDRISNLECNENKSNSSEDFELMHSLMEKNHQQELRINDLENKLNQIQSQPKVESKSIDFLAESDGGLNMMDMLQTKNYEMEQRILKLEKQNKKLVQAVNRLLKTTDE